MQKLRSYWNFEKSLHSYLLSSRNKSIPTTMASITVEDYELRENEEGGSKTIIKKTLKQLTSGTKSLVW